MTSHSGMAAAAPIRQPAVGGSFYPARPEDLRAMVDRALEQADDTAARAGRKTDGRRADQATGLAGREAGEPRGDHTAGRAGREAGGRMALGGPRALGGLLVPHAGLVYSGVVAAAAWRLLRAHPSATIVILGTNHHAGWLDGVGVWEAGAWRLPGFDVVVDHDLAAAIVDLGPPFVVDRPAHAREHSIEVQLPFLHAVAPAARIVPLAVSTGTGATAIEAGARLGGLVAQWRQTADVVLAVSTDMAHYPAEADARRVTDRLLPSILAVDPEALAVRERAISVGTTPGIACGMCGIEPAVLGLSALRAARTGHGTALAAATSADAGGPPGRTVGYLAAAFTRV
jgi:MEMO1 family protein